MAKKTEPKVLRITLIKSPIGYTEVHKGTIRALGLKRMHQTVEHIDAPTLRGMLAKVSPMVRIEEK